MIPPPLGHHAQTVQMWVRRGCSSNRGRPTTEGCLHLHPPLAALQCRRDWELVLLLMSWVLARSGLERACWIAQPGDPYWPSMLVCRPVALRTRSTLAEQLPLAC